MRYGHSLISHKKKLFGDNQQIAKLANIIFVVEKYILLIYDLATFLAGLASKGFSIRILLFG